DCMTPLPATGAPLVTRGGQPWAHGPEQVDCEDVSASNRYSVLPSGPTRNVPRLALVVPTITPAVADGLLEVMALGGADCGVVLFEHAAASRPRATRTTVTLPMLERNMTSS